MGGQVFPGWQRIEMWFPFHLILVFIKASASSRFLVGASVKMKTRPPGSIFSKRTFRPWVILSSLSPPLEYFIVFKESNNSSLFFVDSRKLTFLSCLYETSLTVTSK